MVPLTLFFVVPLVFLLVCTVLYRLNHPKVEPKAEPVRFSQDAMDAVKVLRSTGLHKKTATIMVERIIIQDPDANVEQIVRRAFQQGVR